MSREVRRVAKDWQHPKYGPEAVAAEPWKRDRYVGLFAASFSAALAEYEEVKRQWEAGFERDWSATGLRFKSRVINKSPKSETVAFDDEVGEPPTPDQYMPDWSEAERTHWQLYETVSEGTPISPVFSTPESLARYMAHCLWDDGLNYDQWF